MMHLLLSIPPKISVLSFMGYLKRKSALMMFNQHVNLKYKFGNRHFLVCAEPIFEKSELGILLMTMNLTKLAGILIKAAANFPREQLSNVKKEKN